MKELHKALLKVQQELKTIQTDAKGNFGNYASLEQVLSKSEDILHKNGLLLTQTGNCAVYGAGAQNSLTTTITHVETGQQISSNFLLTPEKPGPQGFGAAMTYFRRYSILALLGKATGDDPDAATQPASNAPLKRTSSKGTASNYSIGDRFIANSPFSPSGGILWKGKKYKDVPLDQLAKHAANLRGKPNLNAYEEKFLSEVALLQMEEVGDNEPPPGRFPDEEISF